MLGRVRVQIDDDGMTIANPGGFVEGIGSDNLLEAEPHGRNAALADAMKRISPAERTGRGVDRIYEGSPLNGRLLPDYSCSAANRVALFIPKGPIDKAFVGFIASEQRRLGRSLPIYSPSTPDALKNILRASASDVAKYLKVDESRIRVTLESPADSEVIEAGGVGRGRYYMLRADYSRCGDPEKSSGKNIEALRRRHIESVLQLAKRKGAITRRDVVDSLRITPPQSYRLLQKPAKTGELALIGRGAGAKYAAK